MVENQGFPGLGSMALIGQILKIYLLLQFLFNLDGTGLILNLGPCLKKWLTRFLNFCLRQKLRAFEKRAFSWVPRTL